MKRRILHVIATLDRSGAEKQLSLLARHLPRDEFDAHVCALTHGGPLAAEIEAAGISVEVLGKRWKFDPLAWWELRKHVAALKPDLVQTWLFTANAYGRTAAASAAPNAKLVASERCVDRWKSWHQLAIDRRLAARTDAIIVNSRAVEDFYLQQGITPAKLRVIHNGVEPCVGSPVSREQLLAELDLPADTRLVGAVGRLWPQKRIKDLIWAIDLLKVIRNDVHLLILGDGPQRADLERYNHLCRTDDKVHFLGARSDVPRFMPHFDALWLASSYEGLANVIMEAMACGVPVVASDIAANRELVVHGETGFLVPVGDRAGYSRCVHKLLEQPELARTLGEAGRRKAESFSVEAMVGKHAALYRELLG